MTTSTKKLGLVHSDMCGPMQVDSIGGSRYFVTFIDDYSRCVVVYFIKHKSEVFKRFKEFDSIVINESGEKFMSIEFQSYLK